MDFTPTEAQQEVSKIARNVFDSQLDGSHLAQLEAGPLRYDADLWQALASTDLLGIAISQDFGGSGERFLELCALLNEVGWAVAPVPVYATLVLGADPIQRFGTEEQRQDILPLVVGGDRLISAGLVEPGLSDPSAIKTKAVRAGKSWIVSGKKALVPAAQMAHQLLIPATLEHGSVEVFIVDTDEAGVTVEPAPTTNGEPFGDVVLNNCVLSYDRILGDGGRGSEIVRSMHTRAMVGLCAMHLGVCERALRIAADYTSTRKQFGRPIGSFQAVQQRLADAFIDIEAMRWTMWYAAWLISEDRVSLRDAAIAKFWASDAGARVVASAQQVHGGVGIDVTYPLFRYFLWSKQIELSLGSASAQLAAIASGYPRSPW
jgi:alkylation response protein AidB-like acyl-CoA dehydrogenase